jgi:hypothetical protein
VTRKATAVERPRCVHCRNPIKDHQAAVGPHEGDRTFHEDCWKAAHPEAVPSAVDRPVVLAEQRSEPVLEQAAAPVAGQAAEPAAEPVVEPVVEQRRPEPSSEQRDYEKRIASDGLAALLSPYVSGLPAQRATTESIPA